MMYFTLLTYWWIVLYRIGHAALSDICVIRVLEKRESRIENGLKKKKIRDMAEQCSIVCLTAYGNVDGPGGHYAKWNKSDRERQIPYDFIYMWNLKSKASEQIKKRLINIENKLVVRVWIKLVKRINRYRIPTVK